MKRIAFITNSIGFGGAEKMLTFVANQLHKRGYFCTIINLNTIANYINAHQQQINVGVEVLTINKPSNQESSRRYYLQEIKKFVKQINPDILISFTESPNIYAKIVGTMLHIPSIMSERGDPNKTNGKRGIKNRLALGIVNQSKGGVFQTDGAKSFYGKSLQKRGIIIPNPIFIKGKIPQVEQHQREKTVVSVGRLDNNQKRYDVMIRAFKIFSEKHPDYILKLYGKGSDEIKIQEWAVELGIADKVKLMGLTTQPMQDTAKDGMFLITSDYEGISNSLLEAMAVGLPCVSTDHTPGGARLLITDRENGLLAPIGDCEKLAQALCEFAENPGFAEKCGMNAKNVVDRFAPEKIIDMWENYILRLAK
jgi:GalNAc-alpha-(1->4)-GalNAc-alpha-(1->3)-diNAcBac-PP-undecaprenol alpha-1,4-N-acetyl-D-galactosaminyltransferase